MLRPRGGVQQAPPACAQAVFLRAGFVGATEGGGRSPQAIQQVLYGLGLRPVAHHVLLVRQQLLPQGPQFLLQGLDYLPQALLGGGRGGRPRLQLGDRLRLRERGLALTHIGGRQLSTQRFDQLVCLRARLAFLLDLQQGAIFGGGCAPIAGLDRLSGFAQVGAEGILLPLLLLGSCLFELRLQFLQAGASEVCGTTMGSFFARRGADGKERWWLEVAGKGGKARLVPATDELVAELIRYRRAIGLKPLPAEADPLPAVLPVIGPAKPLARSAVHERVKELVRRTAARLRESGPEHAAAAAHIEKASTHWLRHTAGTHQSDRMDLKNVRDNLGHENIATTSVYVHTVEDARHDATAAAHREAWSRP